MPQSEHKSIGTSTDPLGERYSCVHYLSPYVVNYLIILGQIVFSVLFMLALVASLIDWCHTRQLVSNSVDFGDLPLSRSFFWNHCQLVPSDCGWFTCNGSFTCTPISDFLWHFGPMLAFLVGSLFYYA